MDLSKIFYHTVGGGGGGGGGGRVYVEDLPKLVVKGRFNFKKFNCIFILSFSQFSKIV